MLALWMICVSNYHTKNMNILNLYSLKTSRISWIVQAKRQIFNFNGFCCPFLRDFHGFFDWGLVALVAWRHGGVKGPSWLKGGWLIVWNTLLILEMFWKSIWEAWLEKIDWNHWCMATCGPKKRAGGRYTVYSLYKSQVYIHSSRPQSKSWSNKQFIHFSCFSSAFWDSHPFCQPPTQKPHPFWKQHETIPCPGPQWNSSHQFVALLFGFVHLEDQVPDDWHWHSGGAKITLKMGWNGHSL